MSTDNAARMRQPRVSESTAPVGFSSWSTNCTSTSLGDVFFNCFNWSWSDFSLDFSFWTLTFLCFRGFCQGKYYILLTCSCQIEFYCVVKPFLVPQSSSKFLHYLLDSHLYIRRNILTHLFEFFYGFDWTFHLRDSFYQAFLAKLSLFVLELAVMVFEAIVAVHGRSPRPSSVVETVEVLNTDWVEFYLGSFSCSVFERWNSWRCCCQFHYLWTKMKRINLIYIQLKLNLTFQSSRMNFWMHSKNFYFNTIYIAMRQKGERQWTEEYNERMELKSREMFLLLLISRVGA